MKINSTTLNGNKEKFSYINLILNIVWVTFSLSGVAIIAYFIWELNFEYTIDYQSKNKIDLTKTAQVGDFIGGLVGALWTFAGIILFYLALKLQNKEFALNRKVMQETQDVMSEQLKSIKFSSDSEMLNHIINSHNETINAYNKKGLLTEEEDNDRTRLIQEKK